MTDEELIARLRSCTSDEAMWSREAADRIEALVKERDEAKRLMQARHREMLAADGLMRKHQRRADRLGAALAPLASIADAYDENELDDEARKRWGKSLTPPKEIEIYAGRGGKQLLTLADAMKARAALKGDTHE